jgi:hypothetical protein
MKNIPGYEIVEGQCEDCEFYSKACRAYCECCNGGEIYKKKSIMKIENELKEDGVDVEAFKERVRQTVRKCKENLKKDGNMTHDEMIEVVKAHKGGKTIQQLDEQKFSKSGTLTKITDILAPTLLELIDAISHGKKLRVKPEPKIIPWTADDWREFKDIKLNVESGTFRVCDWRVFGINFTNDCNYKFYEKYSDLANKKDINGKLCGKVVEE